MKIGRVRFFPPNFWRFVNEWEVFNVPVKIAFGFALWQLPAAAAQTPVLHHLNAIMSLRGWAVYLWTLAALIVIGFILGNIWVVRISYALGTAFWLILFVLTWQYASTYIGLTFYGAFGLATILRQGRLVWEERQAEKRVHELAWRDAEIARLRQQLAGQ